MISIIKCLEDIENVTSFENSFCPFISKHLNLAKSFKKFLAKKKKILVKLYASVCKFAKKQSHLQVLVWKSMSWAYSTTILSLNNNFTTP